MAKELGIEDFKKLVDFGFSTTKVVKQVLADGKVELQEVFQLLPVLMSLPEIISKKDAILEQAKNFTIEEVQQVMAGKEGSESFLYVLENALNAAVSIKNLYFHFTEKKEEVVIP